MIGVIARPAQTAVVEEFFELFKTPWEFWRGDQAYDVVVSTTDDVPRVDARLVVCYGATGTGGDERAGPIVRSSGQGGLLDYDGARVPIYGQLLTFDPGTAVPCVMAANGIAGVRIQRAGGSVVRLGYDLFEEVRALLTDGQPVDHAHVPTLDIHIAMLRDWIVSAGLPLVEVPPVPAGHSFVVCLTHDIDFVGIRLHRFDSSMWGFLYRATVGASNNWLRRRISLGRLLGTWRAVASLPFVYLGWAEDFWEPFSWYLRAERGLGATYFLIPFKRRPGDAVPGVGAARRATAYDIMDVLEWVATLRREGCEIGVHGLDAWHDAEKGREELGRIATATGESRVGVRIHWLLTNTDTQSVLERAGFAYDSSYGYNDTVGYRCGTTQVFRPIGTRAILELPLHIQDGAMFYPQRLDLSEHEAEVRCGGLVNHARRNGGVLTVLWHDRSHGPERYWGDFYVRLLDTLRSSHAWFGTAGQAVAWFQARRTVRFVRTRTGGGDRTSVHYGGEPAHPGFCVRLHRPLALAEDGRWHATPVDLPWSGEASLELDADLALTSGPAAASP
jgi:hypothetical protein